VDFWALARLIAARCSFVKLMVVPFSVVKWEKALAA
jgi:hypothetical protein